MGAPSLKNGYAMFKKLVCQWVNKHNTARVASCWFIIYYRLVMHGNSKIKNFHIGKVKSSHKSYNRQCICQPHTIYACFTIYQYTSWSTATSYNETAVTCFTSPPSGHYRETSKEIHSTEASVYHETDTFGTYVW